METDLGFVWPPLSCIVSLNLIKLAKRYKLPPHIDHGCPHLHNVHKESNLKEHGKTKSSDKYISLRNALTYLLDPKALSAKGGDPLLTSPHLV
jgi:hypothetical protein